MQALEPGDPRSVGGIRVLARISASGPATVYLGRSAGGRALAVKVLSAGRPEARERFRREVANARLAGGYTPAVVDADPEAAAPWLATEFVPSVSLQDAVRAYGPLPAEALWPLAAGVAEALFSIHRAGIAHLDLRPSNVLLTVDGPRLIEFGSTHPIADSGDAGPAGDVHSYGATLAFAGTGSAESAAAIGDDVLRSMVTRCLDPDPGARPTVPELIGHLLSVLPSEPSALLPTGGQELPPAVIAEIERRAYEADNPPLPVVLEDPVDLRTLRRRILLGVAAVVLAGGLGGAAVAVVSYLHSP